MSTVAQEVGDHRLELHLRCVVLHASHGYLGTRPKNVDLVVAWPEIARQGRSIIKALSISHCLSVVTVSCLKSATTSQGCQGSSESSPLLRQGRARQRPVTDCLRWYNLSSGRTGRAQDEISCTNWRKILKWPSPKQGLDEGIPGSCLHPFPCKQGGQPRAAYAQKRKQHSKQSSKACGSEPKVLLRYSRKCRTSWYMAAAREYTDELRRATQLHSWRGRASKAARLRLCQPLAPSPCPWRPEPRSKGGKGQKGPTAFWSRLNSAACSEYSVVFDERLGSSTLACKTGLESWRNGRGLHTATTCLLKSATSTGLLKLSGCEVKKGSCDASPCEIMRALHRPKPLSMCDSLGQSRFTQRRPRRRLSSLRLFVSWPPVIKRHPPALPLFLLLSFGLKMAPVASLPLPPRCLASQFWRNCRSCSDLKQLQVRTPSAPESNMHFLGSCLKGQMLAGTLQQQLVKEFLRLDKRFNNCPTLPWPPPMPPFRLHSPAHGSPGWRASSWQRSFSQCQRCSGQAEQNYYSYVPEKGRWAFHMCSMESWCCRLTTRNFSKAAAARGSSSSSEILPAGLWHSLGRPFQHSVEQHKCQSAICSATSNLEGGGRAKPQKLKLDANSGMNDHAMGTRLLEPGALLKGRLDYRNLPHLRW